MQPPERAAPNPDSIGSYRVERRLGQGGMGEVFLAWDDRLGRRVAIKRIRQGTDWARQGERFRREARAAARLSHPAIVHIYDLVEDDAGLAIVMEYVEGRTLADLTAAGLPEPAVRLAGGAPLRGGQLRHAFRNPFGKRAVRPRAGRLHRGRVEEDGQGRGGGHGHPEDDLIRPEDLLEAVLEAGGGKGEAVTRYHETLNETKKRLILAALAESGGNVTKAGALLGLHPNYLHRLISNLGLRV